MRKATQEEIDDLINYRANHVALVQKLGKVVFDLDLSNHDCDKINAVGDDLELLALRQASKNGKLRLTDEDKEVLRKVSANHALKSKHHGEFWDVNITLRNFDENDNNVIDCRKMPERYLKEMVCDWSACSISKNEPIFGWYNKMCIGDNPKYIFTDKQRDIVVDGLKKIEKYIAKKNISYPGIRYTAKQVEPERMKEEVSSSSFSSFTPEKKSVVINLGKDLEEEKENN